jgi:hypothetical protein
MNVKARVNAEDKRDNKIEYYNQRFELLTIYIKFREDVKEFRKKWHISVLACKKYYENVLVDEGESLKEGGSIVHCEQVKFFEYENVIFGNYMTFGVLKGRRYEKKKDDLYLKYQTEINDLLKKYNLSFRYCNPLKAFIYTNKLMPIPTMHIKESYDSHSEYFDSSVLEIVLYPDSTDSDISVILKKHKEWKASVVSENIKNKRLDFINSKLLKVQQCIIEWKASKNNKSECLDLLDSDISDIQQGIKEFNGREIKIGTISIKKGYLSIIYFRLWKIKQKIGEWKIEKIVKNECLNLTDSYVVDIQKKIKKWRIEENRHRSINKDRYAVMKEFWESLNGTVKTKLTKAQNKIELVTNSSTLENQILDRIFNRQEELKRHTEFNKFNEDDDTLITNSKN